MELEYLPIISSDLGGSDDEMPLEDPHALTSADWINIHNWLTLLWIFLPLMIVFAFSMLVAHGFIPSGVATGDFPESLRKLRLPITIVGLLALALAIVFFILALSATWSTIGFFWDRHFV